jgi:hypothetical protein
VACAPHVDGGVLLHSAAHRLLVILGAKNVCVWGGGGG